ncbi:ImmA/IrrE family metallo-endopeptidase [Metarhizobium album]|uniref:ImmA/IrrE family metallo-endopeptidase n=1 Tax=Metarhizobium album TaxID=2182425 RepID=A0A2U2DQ85_9HYPH|nr:ImmA/IrrE family metallo-endopeptidase [Rhizobium album]PWE55442.1 ImmA/IrrE family metallo-endopeptidase [Rhizobium album]
MKYHNPLPTGASKRAVSDFAEEVADEVNYQPGMPIEHLVADLNGYISYRNAVGDKPESILIEPDRSFEIFLPTMTSMARNRFTIAHELGHLFLHFPLVSEEFPGDGMRAYRWIEGNDQRCEWEANWFAAAFTMPEAMFRKIVDEEGIDAAARFFGVSGQAARVRAKGLEGT